MDITIVKDNLFKDVTLSPDGNIRLVIESEEGECADDTLITILPSGNLELDGVHFTEVSVAELNEIVRVRDLIIKSSN